MGEELRQWLDITQQQFELLKIIFQIEKEKETATPKSIDKVYSTQYKKTIQKPNLFNQLNLLMERGIVIKTGKAQYCTNVDTIKQIIGQRKQNLAKELENCEKASEQVELIKKVLNKPVQPITKYLDGDKIFQEMAIELQRAKAFNMIAGFPGIAFTYGIYGFGERGEYWRALSEGLKSNSMKLRYLTSLDISYPLFYAYKIYKNKNAAIKESLVIIDNLAEMVKQYKNIEIRYSPNDMSGHIIIEKEYPTHTVQLFRNVNRDITGGIVIDSTQVAEDCKNSFLEEFNAAAKVDAKSQALFDSLKKQIKTKGYDILKLYK